MIYKRKKNDNLDFIKNNKYYSAKGNVMRMRRQVTDRGKICPKYISDKEQLSKIYIYNSTRKLTT